MNFFKSYKFIFTITIFLIFISLFYILYLEKIELPNDNWSKEIELNNYNINDKYDDLYKNDTNLIMIDDKYYLLYFSKKNIFISQYDLNMNFIEKNKIENDYINVDNMTTSNINGNISLLFNENNKLINLIINTSGNIINEQILFSNIENINIIDTDIIYYKDNFIFLNNKKIKKIDNINNLSFIKIDNIYYISYIYYNNDNYKYSLNLIKFSNNKIISNKYIKSYSFDNTSKIFNMQLNKTKKNLRFMLIVNNSKFNTFSNYYLVLDNNLKIINKNNYPTKGYNFNFINDNCSYIQNSRTNIGKIDISTKNEIYPNICRFTDNTVIPLTKTKKNPIKVKYYTFNKNDYLLFSQSENNLELSTFIISTNPKLIKKSQKLIFSDYKNLFFTTITTFLPLFLFSQIYSILFLAPIFIIVLPFLIFNITWAEQNSKKLLVISILLYLFAKIKYVFFDITLENLPIIFTNPFFRISITLILSLISIYCMYDYSKNININFIKNFITFFIIDMILFTLFLTPYFLL